MTLPFLDRKPAIPHTFLIEPLNGLKLTTKRGGVQTCIETTATLTRSNLLLKNLISDAHN